MRGAIVSFFYSVSIALLGAALLEALPALVGSPDNSSKG